MASTLEQPWKAYLQELSNEVHDDIDSGATTPVGEPDVKMCPGSESCSREPHALGSTKACAVETKIGIVFMNSSG